MAVHAKLTAEQIVVAQEQCGLPDDDGNALFQECKAVRYCVRRRGRGGRGPHLDETNRIIFVQLLPRRKQTQEKYERELASLAGVFKVRVSIAVFCSMRIVRTGFLSVIDGPRPIFE